MHFFGHRQLHENIHTILRSIIVELIEKNGVTMFYVGTEGEFDRAVASVLKDGEKVYSNIKYFTVCSRIPTDLTVDSHLLYPGGLEGKYQKFAIHYRNIWMIEHSKYVVTYIRYNFGGAAKYADVALRKNKTVLNLCTSSDA